MKKYQLDEDLDAPAGVLLGVALGFVVWLVGVILWNQGWRLLP